MCSDHCTCAGHRVSLYERYDFAGEVGASLSCAKNGTMWLSEWKVSIRSDSLHTGLDADMIALGASGESSSSGFG